MELGVNVPNFGRSTNPDRLRAWAQVTEGLGYDLLMVSDHVVITPDVAEQYPAPFYEPFTTLSWLAGITTRVRLGTTVLIAPYRHPLLTARMAANLNALSGGRFVLGVGVGWARQEFEALGEQHAARGRRTDEILAELQRAWTDTADYGEPTIPIWVGGSSTAALRRTVRYGDAWHPLRQTLSAMEHGLSQLREVADAMDRPMPGFAPRILLRLTDKPVLEDERPAGEGTAEQVLRDLDALRELGAHSVVLDPVETEPAETGWRALATIQEEWKRRDT